MCSVQTAEVYFKKQFSTTFIKHTEFFAISSAAAFCPLNTGNRASGAVCNDPEMTRRQSWFLPHLVTVSVSCKKSLVIHSIGYLHCG